VKRRLRQSISRAWWTALGAVGLPQERWLGLPPATRRIVKTATWLAVALALIAVFGVWHNSALVAAVVLFALIAPRWDRLTVAGRRVGGWVTPVAVLALAISYPYYLDYLPELPLFGPFPQVGTMVVMMIFTMMALGLNFVVGYAGLLDLGYVAFYAVGAYAYALLGTHFGLSFWILLPAAGAMAAFWGMMLGFPVLRLRGDYLAIVTLAFGEIIRLVIVNWREVTNGSSGISGIPKVSFFGLMSFNVSDPNYIAKVLGIAQSGAYYKIFLYYLILGLCLLTAFVTVRLRRLPIGRAWEALREDEIACRSLGINTTTTKLTAFATGAMFGGFAGSFFAARQGFVSPESFVFLESAIILAIVVLGGMGSLVGIAVAAMVMIGGTEALRELDFLKRVFGPDFTPELYRMLLFGMAMVIVMLWKPRGFVGSREPTAFLKQRRAVSGSFTKEGHG